MDVAYAVNERIGGAGIGTPAYYACGALAAKSWLRQALALGYAKIGAQDFALVRREPGDGLSADDQRAFVAVAAPDHGGGGGAGVAGVELERAREKVTAGAEVHGDGFGCG